jgi:hypothetical protein
MGHGLRHGAEAVQCGASRCNAARTGRGADAVLRSGEGGGARAAQAGQVGPGGAGGDGRGGDGCGEDEAGVSLRRGGEGLERPKVLLGVPD